MKEACMICRTKIIIYLCIAMTTAALNKEIMKYLASLGKSQQAKVLHFLKSLVQEKNSSSSQLLSFSGSINAEDLKQMEQAIHEGCEHIDRNEW